MPIPHSRLRQSIIVMFVLAATQGRATRAAEPPLIPRQAFFGNPDRASPQISPDGVRFSYLAPRDGILNVWVQTVGQDDAKPVTQSDRRPIRVRFWAQNSRQIIYQQDPDSEAGSENYHLFAVDLSGGEPVDLTPYPGTQAKLVAADPDFPDEILVAMNNRDPKHHDVWRINTVTADRRLVFQNDEGFAAMMADSRYEIRLATRYDPATGSVEALMRDKADGPWTQLALWGLEDAETSSPLGFSRDGRSIFLMDSQGHDTGRLFEYVIEGADGQPAYKPLAADEKADLGEVLSDPLTGRPQAASFEYTRRRWKILDPSIQADWDRLQSFAPGDVAVVSRDRADRFWVVMYEPDDGPAAFHLYDRRTRSDRFLFVSRSQMVGLPMAKMTAEVIKSRDGLDLVCYLTTPRGVEPRRLPMVLLVHGGPWARDSWGFNRLHQWLANRGYAVLSVNFRGSSGFGKAFLNAGNREWAGKMQDDLIDAVNWAVGRKIADPNRVAIMGGSYGGYATLAGLTFTPDFFACGVDIVGPSHIRTLLETIPPHWAPIRSIFEQRVGRLDEIDWLDRISPLTRAGAITRPLLIGQGRNDPRVKEAESRQIVDAMQAKGLPVTYVLFPDEGHGFARPENNLAFFAITEAFLARHLGGRSEPIGDDMKKSSAEIRAGQDLIPGISAAQP